MLQIPVVPDLEGGIVFGTYGHEIRLVRHDADGTRLGRLALADGPQDLTGDGAGRIIYAGLFDEGVSYGVVDQDLEPLGPRRVLPWDVPLLQYRVRIAGLADGSIVAAGGGQRGVDRWVSRLNSDGDEVWTTPWPIGSEPDNVGDARVADVAVLADGTSAIALTSGALHEGDLSLEAFGPEGQHAWAATIEDVRVRGLTANADTFIVSGQPSFSDGNAYGYSPDGMQVWSKPVALSGRGRAQPCSDTDIIVAADSGFARIAPDGTSTQRNFDLLELAQSQLDGDDVFDGLELTRHDVVCTSEGDVIIVSDLSVITDPTGTCDTDG